MDHVMYVDELPKVGESLMTDNFHRTPGGKGCSQTITATRFGAKTRFLGRIGIDALSLEMRQTMEKENIDLSKLIITPESTVGCAVVLVDKEGKNYVVFNPACTLLLTPEDILSKEDMFVKDDIFALTMEFERETVWQAVRTAHKNGMFICIDPLAIPASDFPEDILPMIDFMKPNESEASALCGFEVNDKKTAEKAAVFLREKGVKMPVISLGSQGLVAHVGDELVYIENHPVKAIDSTGAGDVFIGTFVGEFSQSGDIIHSLKTANISAALSTEIMGAQASIPTPEKVKSFIG